MAAAGPERRRALVLPLLLAAAAPLAGCADARQAAPAAAVNSAGQAPAGGAQVLAESQWRLVGGLPGVDPAAVEITLDIGAPEPGATQQAATLPIGGSGGCNRYDSALSVEGDRVTVAPIAATKRACAPPGGPAERAWLGALSQVRGWRLEGDELLLVAADGSQLRLAR